MRCLILGGSGFIGSSICDRYLQLGHQLRVFERPRVEPYRDFTAGESVEWMTGDFSSTHDVGIALKGMDAVVHLIGTTLPKSSNDNPIYDVQSNLIATLQLLEAMRAEGVRKILFISSGGTVYGRPTILPISENHPTNPLTSYGITKLAIEKYLLLYKDLRGLKPVVLRVANPYGERQRIETAQGVVAALPQPHHVWKAYRNLGGRKRHSGLPACVRRGGGFCPGIGIRRSGERVQHRFRAGGQLERNGKNPQ